MKKTKALSLLLSLLLLLSSLTLPLLAVDAETAADPEQTQTDSADAPAEDDSVPEDRLLSSRTSFSVAAKAALLIDLNTGRAVYEQDADERVYPASLTKIMTCLLALKARQAIPARTCIGCGRCAQVCHAGLLPYEIVRRLENMHYERLPALHP